MDNLAKCTAASMLGAALGNAGSTDPTAAPWLLAGGLFFVWLGWA